MTMASECPDPYRAMWSMAPSRSVDHRHRQLRAQELGGEVLLGRRRAMPGTDGPAPLVASQLDAGQGALGPGKELGRHGLVDEQGLGRVAHAGALGLGVHHDGQGHVEVGGGVDVDVAVAVAVDHVRAPWRARARWR